jgi:hypothetical protein
MTGKWSNLPDQKGGSFTVSGYLALVLLALGLIEAGEIYYLATHRTVQLELSAIKMSEVDSDYYVTHAWPSPNISCCDAFNTICFTRI